MSRIEPIGEALLKRQTYTTWLAWTACTLLGFGTCWLLVVTGGGVAVILFASSTALVPLFQAARHSRRGEPGLAATWSAIGLPVVFLLLWPAMHAAQVGHLLPGFQCDAMADDCEIAPWQDWVPTGLDLLTLLLVAVVVVRSFVARWGHDDPTIAPLNG